MVLRASRRSFDRFAPLALFAHTRTSDPLCTVARLFMDKQTVLLDVSSFFLSVQTQ